MSRHSRRLPVAGACAAALLAFVAGCGSDAPSVSTSGAASTASEPNATEASSPSTSESTATSSTSSSTSSTSSASSAASSSVPGTRSDLIRFCDDDGVSSEGGCSSHQKSIAEVSQIHCAANLPASVRGTIKAEIFRNGEQVYATQTEGSAGVGTMKLHYAVGDLTLPGGTYTCRMSAADRTWVGSTEVKGPTGRASQGMACPLDSMKSAGSVSHCTSHNKTMKNPSGLGCSAVATGLKGRKIKVTINTPVGSKDVSLSSSFELGAAVVHLKVPKTSFTGEALPRGDYSCEFTADGDSLITVPFTVS